MRRALTTVGLLAAIAVAVATLTGLLLLIHLVGGQPISVVVVDASLAFAAVFCSFQASPEDIDIFSVDESNIVARPNVLIVPEAAINYDATRKASVDVLDSKERTGRRRVPIKAGISNGTRTNQGTRAFANWDERFSPV